MVAEEETRSYWKSCFPVCPICKVNAHVEVSGFKHNYIQCVACGAKWCWMGKNFYLAESARDGRGGAYHGRTESVAFWQNLRETDVTGTPTIILQKGEKQIKYFDKFQEFVGAMFVGDKGGLIVTNQRVLFASGSLHTIVYGINLENIMSISLLANAPNGILLLAKNGLRKTFDDHGTKQINELISTINIAITERMNELQAQKERERVQVILDFSSLKDVVTKGGIVMSSYNCPKCNGMVDIPETGKILICKYCGTPIKPVDIFEKIKSLIQ